MAIPKNGKYQRPAEVHRRKPVGTYKCRKIGTNNMRV